MKRVFKKLAVISAAAVLMLAAAVPSWAKTRLDTAADLYWNEDDDNDNKKTEAVWEEVEEAYQYELRLYHEGSLKKDGLKTKDTHYNFKKWMDKEGEYTFRVKAIAKKNDKDYSDGSWSDYSDALYITESRAEWNKSLTTGVQPASTTEGPGAGWKQDEKGWWYQKNDGSYPAGCWFQDPSDKNWYMFDAAGYMMTGWIDEPDGKRYYCDPTGIPYGAMVTGERVIDGVAYQFDASGALIQ